MFKLPRAGLVTAVMTPYFCVCSGTERLGEQPTHQTMWFFTKSVMAHTASTQDLKEVSRAECLGGKRGRMNLSSGTKLPKHDTLTRQESCVNASQFNYD